MSFDLKKFTKKIYDEYKDSLTKEEIEDLLNLNDEYNKDTPVSIGKRLVISSVCLVGEKSSSSNQDYSGNKINFSLPFKSGVNILIADNLKGKSSVFKVLKYALTGRNSLKPNIKKWIHYAFVNFYINEKKYTAYLDLTSHRLYACLLNGFISSIDGIKTYSREKIFEANNENSYQEKMNNFFFNQFTYYSLRWTQKSPVKNSDDLIEVGTSWKTYFKSILLESKDSGEIYGAQGKKIFQMLLGIELTYPINRLSIKKDMLLFNKAKERSYTERKKEKEKLELSKLHNQLKEIENEILTLQTKSRQKVNLASVYNDYSDILKLINSKNKKVQEITIKKQSKNLEISIIKREQNGNKEEIFRLNKELEKSIKKLNDLKEYIEIGILFSNLDIKHCPSCNKSISESHKITSIKEHMCSLCGEDVDNDKNEVDTEVYKEKIKNLELAIKSIEKEIGKLNKQKELLEESFIKSYNELVNLEDTDRLMKDISSLSFELEKLEEIINTSKSDVILDVDKKEKLVAEKAVILFQINQLTDSEPKLISDYDIKIELLSFAIEKLSEERLSIGRRVIDRLSKLMINEINALGLNSITEIKIDDKFEIHYKQDGDFIKFDNIAEGEQLRAKIAFYLSLIQLDIEFNFGRHTRLLIIDSPGKEEGDKRYLQGLTEVLNSIEDRYGDELQILIGTAERQFSGILKNQKEVPVGKYVF